MLRSERALPNAPGGPGAATVLGALAVVLPVLFAVSIGFGLLGTSALTVSAIAFVIAPAGAAGSLLSWSRRYEGRERVAWATIGVGVALWWLAEVTWQIYVWGLGVEVPYPSLADVFYVAGYPVVGVGMLLLPHVRLRSLERVRLVLDTFVGTFALIAIAWTMHLSRYVSLDGWSLEAFLDAFYPVTDLLLLAALLVMSLRPSRYTMDHRMAALAAGVVMMSAADIIYLEQVATDTYVDGGFVDAIWLLGYTGFALAGFLSRRRPQLRDSATRPMSLWQLAAPYLLVGALFLAAASQVVGDDAIDPLLAWSAGIVAGLVFLRQAVAIRENRRLIERQRDELVASISHELRTPLTAVTGFTQLLREGGMSPQEQQEMLEIVDTQAQHVNRIVVDLIAVARGKVGGAPPEPTTFDIATLVSESVTMSALRDSEVSVDAERGLFVRADRSRMAQVAVNLLTNAQRYGRRRILVTARRVEDYVQVSVHDDGEGVPRRFHDSIWERFERGAHRLDATVPGSGIGLYVVRSLVEAHGGTVWYQRSDRLGGACFTFALPASSEGAA